MDTQMTSVGAVNTHEILWESTSSGFIATEQCHKLVEGISMEKQAKASAHEVRPYTVILKPT
jgi:hypothetical protein